MGDTGREQGQYSPTKTADSETGAPFRAPALADALAAILARCSTDAERLEALESLAARFPLPDLPPDPAALAGAPRSRPPQGLGGNVGERGEARP